MRSAQRSVACRRNNVPIAFSRCCLLPWRRCACVGVSIQLGSATISDPQNEHWHRLLFYCLFKFFYCLKSGLPTCMKLAVKAAQTADFVLSETSCCGANSTWTASGRIRPGARGRKDDVVESAERRHCSVQNQSIDANMDAAVARC